jgi:hypothetical protein
MNDHGFATIQIWTKVTRSAFRCVPRFKANDDDVLKSSCTQNITTKPGLSKQTLSHHTLCYSSNAVGIATTLQAGRNAFRNPAGAREGNEAHQASYSMRTRVLSPGAKLTIHFRLVPRLRMSGAVPLLPPYTRSWRGQGQRYLYLKSALFWDITQRRVVILYRRFGTTYRSHL